jgi:hypothetical protein
MSDLVIKDGTGTGNRAKVDGENRLETFGVSVSRISHESEGHGEAYLLDSGVKTLTSTAEHLLSWIKLTQPTDMTGVFNRLGISWNGGSTNFNRPAEIRVYGGTVEPTANNAAFTPLNLNFGSANTAQGTFWTWDGVGVGMTTASLGLLAMSFIVSQGTTLIDFNDAIVLPTNSVLGVTCIGNEIGDVGLSALGYFEEEH